MTHWDIIVQVGLDNYGLVTYADGKNAGFADIELQRWAKSGRLQRLSRGVYRLTQYVPTPYDLYAEAVATVGPEAYLSGESVLALHDLALVNPGIMSVASPRRVRKRLPDWISVRTTKSKPGKTVYFGIPSETIFDAIRDCRGTVPVSRLREAAESAYGDGKLLKREAEELRKELA